MCRVSSLPERALLRSLSWPYRRGPGLLCPGPPWLWVCFTSLHYLVNWKSGCCCAVSCIPTPLESAAPCQTLGLPIVGVLVQSHLNSRYHRLLESVEPDAISSIRSGCVPRDQFRALTDCGAEADWTTLALASLSRYFNGTVSPP